MQPTPLSLCLQVLTDIAVLKNDQHDMLSSASLQVWKSLNKHLKGKLLLLGHLCLVRCVDPHPSPLTRQTPLARTLRQDTDASCGESLSSLYDRLRG